MLKRKIVETSTIYSDSGMITCSTVTATEELEGTFSELAAIYPMNELRVAAFSGSSGVCGCGGRNFSPNCKPGKSKKRRT